MDNLKGRVLAIDPGMKKVGLAISDPTQTLAQAFEIWEFDGEFWRKLNEVILEKEVRLILVGVPFGFKGETEQTVWVQDFVEEVKRKVGIKVETADEIFTTKIGQMERGHLKKKERQKADDAAAARVLLQSWLDCQVE